MDVDEHELTSASGEYRRKVWLSADRSGGPRRLCIVLDGEHYLGRIDAPTTIDRLRAEGSLPPVSFVFVSSHDLEARHYDYTCNARYSRFIARDVVAWAQAADPLIDTQAYAACGSSLSGLASAYLCLAYPELFGGAVSQSGSFWWNREWYRRTVESRAPVHGRFWLCVGDKETATGLSHAPTGLRQEVSQADGVKRAAQALAAAGAQVRLREFHGGHDFLRWKDDLPDALAWVLGGAEAPVGDSVAVEARSPSS